MNIYFTASLARKPELLANYQLIVDWLTRHRHTVQASHILEASESQISQQTLAQHQQFHHQLEQWIRASQCVIVEASFPSISVGYEISLALHWNKPVLILYTQGHPPSLFNHYLEEKILCEKYNPSTLPDTLFNFLDYTKGHSDIRYTFSLPSYLARYLDSAATRAHLPKAAYLRQLLEKDCGCAAS